MNIFGNLTFEFDLMTFIVSLLKKLKIRDIYIQQLAVHMYRYHHDLLPPGLPNNKFTVQSDIHNYNTRQALDLHIDPTNTKLAKNTIKTQGPMIWNSINKTIKNCRSLVSFKTPLKNIFLLNMSLMSPQISTLL